MTSWVKFHALICHHCLGPNLTPSAQTCREPSAAKTVTAMSLAPNLVLEQIQSHGWSGTFSLHQIITLMETSEVGDSYHLAVPGMEAEEAKSCWNSWHSSCVSCSGWGRFYLYCTSCRIHHLWQWLEPFDTRSSHSNWNWEFSGGLFCPHLAQGFSLTHEVQGPPCGCSEKSLRVHDVHRVSPHVLAHITPSVSRNRIDLPYQS